MDSRQGHFSQEALMFLKKFIKDPSSVGSIFPSSQALALAMTSKVSPVGRYLEIGPGTGVFTEEILKKNDPEQTLDLVELDPDFCSLLRNKFLKENIFLYEGSIMEWDPEYFYDGIISSLPLNAFKPEFAAQILEKLHRLIRPGGLLSYYEYVALPELRQLFLSKKVKEEFRKTVELVTNFYQDYEVESELIWTNFPPAKVHHCCVGKSD